MVAEGFGLVVGFVGLCGLQVCGRELVLVVAG